MTRVEELQKSYPTLPREFIVKWDVMSQGIKDTEEIDKVSSWYGGGSYQSRDHGITLKEIADKRPGTVRPGYVLRPKSFYMKSGLGARFARSRTSPYQIREIGDSQFSLFEGEEKIEDIYFVSPEWWGDDRVTSKGTRASTLVSVLGSCVKMQPVRFCEYFTRGEQCKFCNYNSTYEDAHAVGGTSPITLSLEDTVEAYTMLASEVKLIESRWQSGALRGSEQEEAMYLKFVERIAGAASYPVNMTLSTPFHKYHNVS
ncbi:MAG: hypothetical protein Q7O66_14845 [Dehalococcoidia bacterium]|nr:hypothetical protein [Dehalococcoidia bacterium]